MSYLIIIRGPLGCGKSTVAKKLSGILHAEYISIDDVLEKHGLDKSDPDKRSIPLKNFIKANEIALPKIKGEIKKGTPVIVDANFYHKEAVEHLLRSLPSPHFVFTLKAPIDVCIERDKKRKKPLGEASTRAIYQLVSRFDYGTNIDASKSLDETVQKILSFLPDTTKKAYT